MKSLVPTVLNPILAVLCAVVCANCSTTSGDGKSLGKVYTAAQSERVTVVSRRVERMPATRGRVGGQAGSVAGSVGGGIAGSILGGIVGPAVEKAVIKKKISHYTLRRQDGSEITLMQDDRRAPLQPGQSAYLIREGDGTSRVEAVLPRS